ncbi:MAG: D-alanyl-D-alanine carboxypeptidase [Alphaproteobacteria bacterium]|nr:D-alanyl-D-alanine carboxypeptidase [Alphaproteobacteria bacterium]
MKKTTALLLACLIAALPARAFDTAARHALLMDADTGYVMLDKKSDVPMPPASMSKLMTAYVVFDMIKSGKLSPETECAVSENAWRKGGTKSGGSTMFLNPNQRVKVIDLLRGMIIQSGNDACIVLAENIAGSEEIFSDLMNKKAREIGLKDSVFKNATGLPERGHVMSARDLAVLARAIIRDFPEHYPMYSEKDFEFNKIRQGNRNPLLYDLSGADGLKTGHTEASGYGLTASVKGVDGRRLILVVNGLKSMKDRAAESRRLVNWGMTHFANEAVVSAQQKLDDIPVWMGRADKVAAVAGKTLPVTRARGETIAPEIKIAYDSPVAAPVEKGQKLGTITISVPGREALTADLVAGESVEKVGFFGKIKALCLLLAGR